MNSKVCEYIENQQMLKSGQHVVAAVSGGADSIAMLLLLKEICPKYSCTLSVCHVDHGLRGEESKRDAQFVKDFAEKLSIPCKIVFADIRKLCADTKESIETCARRVRYEILEREAGDGIIATAHTQSDNVETVLFHIARGSGLQGLCGIPPRRGNIIRPLLCVSREQVEQYLRSVGVDFVTDSSNLCDEYTRNKIRHHAVPVLKDINPALEEAVGGLCETVAEDQAYLRSLAQDAIKDDLPVQELSAPILSRYIMMRANDECGITLSRQAVHAVRDIVSAGEGKVSLPQDCFAQMRHGKLMFFADIASPFCVPFELGTVTTPYAQYETEVLCREVLEKKLKIHKKLLNSTLDYDKIKGNIMMRSRIDGDKLRINGRGCTKSMRKLFGEARVPEAIRSKYALLASEDTVFWAETFGVNECCAPTQKTERFLLIQKKEMES